MSFSRILLHAFVISKLPSSLKFIYSPPFFSLAHKIFMLIPFDFNQHRIPFLTELIFPTSRTCSHKIWECSPLVLVIKSSIRSIVGSGLLHSLLAIISWPGGCWLSISLLLPEFSQCDRRPLVKIQANLQTRFCTFATRSLGTHAPQFLSFTTQPPHSDKVLQSDERIGIALLGNSPPQHWLLVLWVVKSCVSEITSRRGCEAVRDGWFCFALGDIGWRRRKKKRLVEMICNRQSGT